MTEQNFETTAALVDAAIVQARRDEGPRGHLGMSQIGGEDLRRLWLSFRWCMPDVQDPRVLRIFDDGNRIESQVIADLRRAGLEIYDVDPATGKQFRFAGAGGHYGGSCDGVGRGFPENPGAWHIVEVKSANADQFKAFQEKGAKDWRPEYWAQCQAYMAAANLNHAVLIVRNKNNGDQDFEFIDRDPMVGPGLTAQAERLIESMDPPESPWPNREFYKARFMSADEQAIYWGDHLPRPNCRNCRHSVPITEGDGARWRCEKGGIRLLNLVDQFEGCGDHNFIPDLVAADLVDVGPDYCEYRKDGAQFWNVPRQSSSSAGAYTSTELRALSRGAGLTAENLRDPLTDDIRTMFDAKVIDQPTED